MWTVFLCKNSALALDPGAISLSHTSPRSPICVHYLPSSLWPYTIPSQTNENQRSHTDDQVHPLYKYWPPYPTVKRHMHFHRNIQTKLLQMLSWERKGLTGKQQQGLEGILRRRYGLDCCSLSWSWNKWMEIPRRETAFKFGEPPWGIPETMGQLKPWLQEG